MRGSLLGGGGSRYRGAGDLGRLGLGRGERDALSHSNAQGEEDGVEPASVHVFGSDFGGRDGDELSRTGMLKTRRVSGGGMFDGIVEEVDSQEIWSETGAGVFDCMTEDVSRQQSRIVGGGAWQDAGREGMPGVSGGITGEAPRTSTLQDDVVHPPRVRVTGKWFGGEDGASKGGGVSEGKQPKDAPAHVAGKWFGGGAGAEAKEGEVAARNKMQDDGKPAKKRVFFGGVFASIGAHSSAAATGKEGGDKRTAHLRPPLGIGGQKQGTPDMLILEETGDVSGVSSPTSSYSR